MTNETNPGTVEALEKCRDQFKFYVEQHMAKSPPDTAKAATNLDFVELCEKALATQSQPAATVQEVGREAELIALVTAIAVEAQKAGLDVMHMLHSSSCAALRALTAEPAAKAGDAEPESDWELECKAFAYANDLKLSANVRDFIKELWKAYCLASPSPQPDMGSGKDEVREQVARIISLAKGQPETGQTSIGAWWWDARHDRAKPDHFEGECREEDRKHADLMIPLLRAALSPPASQSVEKDALKAAYEAGALAVHEYWQSNPGEAPRGDPEFGEAASDYAAAALPHKEEATPAPVGEQGAVAGWRLVPVEITQAMLDATRCDEADDLQMRDTWKALLAAAPAPPSTETKESGE